MQLRFLQKNKEEKDMIIAVAGSGGKTTRVHKLAQYYRSLGKKVFVTTTTHMKKESDTVIPENIEDIRKQLNETGYCMAGMPATPENALVQKSAITEDSMNCSKRSRYHADRSRWFQGYAGKDSSGL